MRMLTILVFLASINVPIAMATANTTNNTPVSLLENNIFFSVFIQIFMGYKFNTILAYFIPNYIIYFVNFD